MIRLREWRRFKEETSPAVTDDVTPTAQDWEYYQQQLKGQAMIYLGKFLAKVSPDLNLARKGFILQEVIQGLGMSPSDVTRVINNIKHSAPPEQQAAVPPPMPSTAPVPSSSPTPAV